MTDAANSSSGSNLWIEADPDLRMAAVDAAQDFIKQQSGRDRHIVPWSVLEEAIYVAIRIIESGQDIGS